MVLKRIDIYGLNDIYAVSMLEKEFKNAVDEPWKTEPPWKRYRKKLLLNLAVLDEYKEQAIDFPQYEKLSGEDKLYSIRYPNSKKNVRILYTIVEGYVILLTAFLEKNDGDYQRAIHLAKKQIRELESWYGESVLEE